MEKRIPINSPNASHIEVRLIYQLGGVNYLNYRNEPRGYYVTVKPVTVHSNGISFNRLCGVKHLLLAVKRRSKKAEAEAIRLLTPELEARLINKVLAADAAESTRKAVQAELGISIPPRYDGLDAVHIAAMPVEVITDNGRLTYPNIIAAKKEHDLTTFCGAMYGRINGVDGLRFESPEANETLSR